MSLYSELKSVDCLGELARDAGVLAVRLVLGLVHQLQLVRDTACGLRFRQTQRRR